MHILNCKGEVCRFRKPFDAKVEPGSVVVLNTVSSNPNIKLSERAFTDDEDAFSAANRFPESKSEDISTSFPNLNVL